MAAELSPATCGTAIERPSPPRWAMMYWATMLTAISLGDSALTVDFGNRINEPTNERVLQLFYRLQNSAPFISDVIPAYSSLTVYYDVWQLHYTKTSAYEAAKHWIEEKLKEETETKHSIHRQVEIPVCYAETFAPDLHSLAEAKGLNPDAPRSLSKVTRTL